MCLFWVHQPSSISIVNLHMLCILNWLVARPQQCLNWRCICLGSYIKCLLGCLCDRMELEPPWGPRTEVILYIVAKFEIAKNLHFQIWNIFPVPKILSNLQNPLQSSKSLNFVQHETWWQYIQMWEGSVQTGNIFFIWISILKQFLPFNFDKS